MIKQLTIDGIKALVIAFVAVSIQQRMGGDFLVKFLDDNMLTILIALFAVNSATMGVILSKVRDLVDRDGVDGKIHFKETRKQMTISIYEQFTLIILAVVCGVVASNTWLMSNTEFVFWLSVFKVGIFAYAMQVLFDLSRSIMKIIDY